MRMRVLGVLLCAGAFLFSCRGIPEGVSAVEGFVVENYLGKWFEVARFDFRFERDLSHVTTVYALNEDGSVRVENTGFAFKEGKWKQSVGRAVFRGENSVGALKVSFFGPFYSGYNVIALDGDYEYALVCGKNHQYLWILSRTPQIPLEIKERFLKIASEAGFDTSQLVWTIQD